MSATIPLFIWNRIVSEAAAGPDHPPNLRGDIWVRMHPGPIRALQVIACCFLPSTGMILIPLFFYMMAALAFAGKHLPSGQATR